MLVALAAITIMTFDDIQTEAEQKRSDSTLKKLEYPEVACGPTSAKILVKNVIHSHQCVQDDALCRTLVTA